MKTETSVRISVLFFLLQKSPLTILKLRCETNTEYQIYKISTLIELIGYKNKRYKHKAKTQEDNFRQ